MRPENLKLILQSYIESKQCQDECDSPEKLAVECDAPFSSSIFSTQGYQFHLGGFDVSSIHNHSSHASPSPPPLHFFPFGFEPVPNLPNNVIEAGRNLVQMAHEFSLSQPDKSIIKFKELCMIKEPIEQIISIPVIRDKEFSNKVTNVSWKTVDKTAISGTHYVESSGDIIFNEGDISKDIQIQILKCAALTGDLRFTVELNYDSLFTPKPMTVSLKNIENLEYSEKSVLSSLPSFDSPFSVADVKFVLDNCLNARTFHMVLTHLCSTTNKVDAQIALACELSSMCLNRSSGSALPGDTIFKVLSDFFKRDEYDF